MHPIKDRVFTLFLFLHFFKMIWVRPETPLVRFILLGVFEVFRLKTPK